MTEDKSIQIRNIYYMLAYAFQVLKQEEYKSVAAEKFERIDDLFAAILSLGISRQIRKGLYREYVSESDDLSLLHGHLSMPGTIRNEIRQTGKLHCEFDDLETDNRYNRILKATLLRLLNTETVKDEQKNSIRRNLVELNGIGTINSNAIPWSTICIDKNHEEYRMLLNICYFVLSGLIETTDDGKYQSIMFSDERMNRVYEKFILNYYKFHYPMLNAAPRRIDWRVDKESPSKGIEFLPSMLTDITLTHAGRTMIIDAKYYGHTMQVQYDKYSYHNNNMNQIFTYVARSDPYNTGNTEGMLLYAKTNETIVPDGEFTLEGNHRFFVRTLDLNLPFEGICKELNQIADAFIRRS